MKGGGVGANYSNDYIDRYPALKSKVNVRCYIPPEYEDEDIRICVSRKLIEVDSEGKPVYPPPQYVEGSMRVQDSREGWYKALNRVLEAYLTDVPVQYLQFDLSMLRPKGHIIKQFGGVASGPWALAKLLKDVSQYLNTRVGHKLTSLDWMMVDHLIAACVVAGNIRRSARMSIKHWRDPDIFDFINCKKDVNLHWSTNISVETDTDFWNQISSMDGPVNGAAMITWAQAHAVLEKVAEGMLTNGEPGIVNTSLASVGETGDVRSSNPCGEIFLEEFENCNLGHVNIGGSFDSISRRDSFRLMQRYLIRATFGDITDPEQREVVDRNRRTGVGIFGFQAWLNKNGIRFSEAAEDISVKHALKDWKNICRVTASGYAKELGIPEPIKVTTIAPTGTIAKLSGTTEGMHPIFARYFLRRVRYDASDSKVQAMYALGYSVEKDLASENTAVVTFPVEDILMAEVPEAYRDLVEDVSEISFETMLSVQRMLQECYVDNAIAVTINVEPGKYSVEWIQDCLQAYGPFLKGVTIMPEISRPQMPYERMTKEEFLATGVGKVGQSEMDCVTGACPVK